MEYIINIKNISFSYGNNDILKNINIRIEKKKLTGILGPNGCGKSTLLRNILKYLKPECGLIEIKNKDIKSYKQKEIAQVLGFVPQKSALAMPLTVNEMIYMGRTSRQKNSFSGYRQEDDNVVEKVVKLLKLEKFRERSVFSLSGGEFQRVLLARALVQEPEILLLDEPTSALDINHALEIMKITAHSVKAAGLTGVVVLHDLNLAAMYCDNIIFLKNGEVKYGGTPEELFKPEILEEIYGFKCQIFNNGGHPYVLPEKI